MKMSKKLKLILSLILLGWAGMAKAQYSGAPIVDVTSGSAKYQTIGTAINGWASAFNPSTNTALNNRGAIIDQVEATATAAAKDEITDAEYDALADVIYWWLQKITAEGVATGDGNNIKSGGWRMGFLVDPSFSSGDNSVWELYGEEVLFHEGYVALDGIKIPSGCRLVIFTSISKSTIRKRYDGGVYTAPNVMFQSTGGKLIFFARSNNQLALDGGKNRTDAASYSDVLNRNDEVSSEGQLCHIHGGGALLSTYTSFQNNATGSAAVRNSINEKFNGGAVAFSGDVSLASFYKATVKNNSTQNHFEGIEWSCFGGGIGIQDIGTTGGFYFNQCEINGNYTEGHGGGVAAYFDGNSNAEIVFKNTTFKYNCQAEQEEHHGGGLWYHDSGSSRSCEVASCSFVNNYAAGKTAGGGGISNEGHITITGCIFDSNVAQNSFGGAICARPALDLTTLKKIDMEISGCSFTNNQAKWKQDIGSGGGSESDYERGSGGAIFIELRRDSHDATNCQYISSLEVKDDCVFNGNHADRNGGGIAIVMPEDMKTYMINNPSLVSSDLKIYDAIIENNNVGQTAIPWTGTYNHDNGGAIYLLSTDLTINPNAANGDVVLVKDNNAPLNGGAAAIFGASLTMTGGQFGESGHPNTSKDGAAVYVSDGNVTVSNATFAYNEASGNGGGFYVSGGSVNLTNATVDHNKSMTVSGYGGYGGGFYVVEGSAGTIGNTTITGSNVSYNEADVVGGGFFVNGGVTTVKGGACIEGNGATNGAGAYVNGGTLNVQDATTIAKSNVAEENGGGFYVNGGVFNLTGGAIGASSYPNQAANGGGVYANGGTISISNGNIQYNTAGNGAGFYLTETGTASISGENSYIKNNIATVNGGGVYSEATGSGTTAGFTMNGGTLQSNQAANGGGVYVQGGTATIEGGKVQYNTATNGGGLYMKGTDSSTASATFRSGSFLNNVATEAAGGIYVAEYAYLEMSGASIINGNNVPSGKKGGGVLIDQGTMKVMGGTGSSINVFGNYAGEIANRNNVYLNGHDDYITIDETNDIAEAVLIGISVDGVLPKPVLYSTDPDKLNVIYNKMQAYYNDPSAAPSGIFDDAHKYSPLYANLPPTFTKNYIYFVSTWFSEIYDNKPEGFAFDDIDSPEDLAWFMFLANCQGGKKNEGKITADIDMSKTLWVPIGEFHDPDPSLTFPDAEPFEGTLEGNGHVISGLKTEGLTNYKYYGLFGRTKGATISNIVLTDCNFVSGEAKRMGCLIGEMDGGTVENCVVGGTVNVSGSESQYNTDGVCEDDFYCVAGGLVGETIGTTSINNCISTAEVIATVKEDPIYVLSQKYTVGGLVGKTSDLTTIENGFANALIRHDGKTVTEYTIPETGKPYDDRTPIDRFVGGLVGYNEGTLTNCYVRLERGVEVTDKSKFGMFAGSNTGNISYCYAPDKTEFSHSYPYLYDNLTSGISYYGDYAAAITPYYYKHDDNKVTMKDGTVEGANLLAKLNTWVGNNATYSHWMRTSASPVNGDYPVLAFDNLDGTLDYTAVGSKDGIQLEYGHSVNTMIERFNGYAAGGSLYVYKTPGGNTSKGFVAEEIDKANKEEVALYIKEDVALNNTVSLPSTYVGITLDNSAGVNGANPYAGGTDAIDWHMFATPLEGAPLGIHYTDEDQHPFTWDVQANPLCSFYDEATDDGYFPSKTFGTTDPETGSYYHDWDFYTYDEPSYHWINFKRNKQSHWHEDVGYGVDASIPENHEHIDYTGTEYESGLQRGKGYLLAAKSSTFLQSHGTLKTGDLEGYTLTASASEETGCKGYNLIGNPYQSYLDFDEFAETNNEGIEKEEDKITSYIILDEDAKGYVSYAVDGSVNHYPSAEGDGPAEGYKAPTNLINMHQGFFVVANSQRTVKFNNDMRKFTADGNTHFRGTDRPAYPLVNLAVTEENGNRDYLTVELDRPDTGGAVKMKGIRMGTSQIYTHCGDEDYAIAFMPCGTTAVPVRFETTEAGTFSLCWNTCNGTFSYLHLIDNMAGVDIDCLASDEYRFTASPTDYASRFRLVFSYTGVEEDEAASASSASFAFMHDGNLIVNGKGMLEVIDMNGRTVASKRLGDAQNTVGLPRMAQGVYVLKLTNDNQSKVQKIVID